MPSFLGEPAEMLGLVLLKYGALELLHFGCKVGALTSPDDIHGRIFAPKSFVLRADDLTECIEIRNSFVGYFESAMHATFINPFE